MKKAFTLVEVVVIASIVALLVGVAYASFANARANAQDRKFAANAVIINEANARYLERYGVVVNGGVAEFGVYSNADDSDTLDEFNAIVDEVLNFSSTVKREQFENQDYMYVDEKMGHFIPRLNKPDRNASECNLPGFDKAHSELLCKGVKSFVTTSSEDYYVGSFAAEETVGGVWGNCNDLATWVKVYRYDRTDGSYETYRSITDAEGAKYSTNGNLGSLGTFLSNARHNCVDLTGTGDTDSYGATDNNCNGSGPYPPAPSPYVCQEGGIE